MAHRYYCPPQDILPAEARLTLRGEEAAHLARVLRAAPGQQITVFDGCGQCYSCRIADIGPQAVACEILSSTPGVSEATLAVTLYVGYPKGDKLEHIIQKATELGAAAVVPFFSRYCVAAPKKEEQKNQRYRRIALEAAKQAGRDRLPQVALPLTFAEVLARLPGYDAALFCYEAQPQGPSLHSRLAGAKRVAIVTGAEGGFSAEEAAQAAALCTPVSLGPRILRCETAPLAALAAVLTLTGNLGSLGQKYDL